MPRSDLILILDGEMTGNTNDDELIEIGIVALEAPNWDEVDSIDYVIQPSDEYRDIFLAKRGTAPIWEALEANGLMTDIEMRNGWPAPVVDREINRWLDGMSNAKNRGTHIPYGGSGVTWYDRKYIDKTLPDFSKRITYRAFDVSVLRSTWALAGVPWSPSYETKTHRALDDARAHAEELRYALHFLRDGQEAKDKMEIKRLYP